MSAYVTIKCNGTFDEGRMPCRGAYSLPAARHATAISGGDLTDLYGARNEAFSHGWSGDVLGRDYCPAHTRARRLEAMRQSYIDAYDRTEVMVYAALGSASAAEKLRELDRDRPRP